MSRLSLWLLATALFGIGCNNTDQVGQPDAQAQAGSTAGSTTDKPQENSIPTDSAANENKTEIEDPPIAVDDTRQSLAGKWVMFLSQRGTDFPVVLLEISAAAGKSAGVKVLDSSAALPDPKLKSFRREKESITLVFDIGDTKLTFEGHLTEGTVWGNALFAIEGGRCDPARLVATKTDSLEDHDRKESDGREEFTAAFDQEDAAQAIRNFAKQHSRSPLAIDGYERILGLSKRWKLDEATVKEVIDEYLKLAKSWGPRMEQMARINVGFNLAMTRQLPKLAMQYLDESEAGLKQHPNDGWKEFIQTGKKNAGIAIALEQASGEDEAEKKIGAASLEKFNETEVFNPLIIYALGRYAEEQDQVDAAIDHYAQLAALPSMESMLLREWSVDGTEFPLPSEAAAALWKKKHGSTDGFDEHLDKIYKQSVHSLSRGQVEPRTKDGGNRVVLCELFTGAQCPPCVAADIATGALEATYKKSEVIVLRYHQHVPGPDPLANANTEARFFYYKGRGTPMVYLNGELDDNVGGFLENVGDIYERLRSKIDKKLTETTKVTLSLKAEASQGKLKISAAANGVEKISGPLRLRIVIAEEEIAFLARNGIRLHEMIVRSMPGGVEGIAPSEGKLSYSESINLTEFKQGLSKYLADFEKATGQDFSAKPLWLEKLHVIAFVQNDATQEVLQSVIVPVTGELEYGEEEEKPEDLPTPAKKPAKSKKPASKTDSNTKPE